MDEVILGAFLGYIVGSCFELNNYQSKDLELFTSDYEIADDNIMTIAVAKAVMEAQNIYRSSSGKCNNEYYSNVERLKVYYMQQIGRKYPNCGYGGMFYRWVFSDAPQPYNSFGNGAAMRISPAGFAAETEDEVIQLSRAITGVTHNHLEGIKDAEVVAGAIFMARNGCTKNDPR